MSEALWNAVRSTLRSQREGPPLERASREKPPAASFAQRSGWIIEQLHPASSLYNMSFALRMKGHLETVYLQRSFEEVVRRHEPLRTILRFIDGTLCQVILPPTEFAIPFTNVTESEAEREVAAEGRLPFDPDKAPLVRARLFRLDKTDHILVITIHHLAFDGWSFSPFMRELAAIYSALIAGHPSPQKDPVLQYADWAVWQQRRLNDGACAPSLRYWSEQLRRPVPALRLPFDRPRRRGSASEIGRHSFGLSTELTQTLKQLATEMETTPFVILLAAFQAFLYGITGEEDIVVGSPIANRNRIELEGMIGVFINTLALRVWLGGRPSFRELVRRVRDVVLDAYKHQELPFELWSRSLPWERENTSTPLLQAAFVFQNLPKSSWEFHGLHVEASEVFNGVAHRDLTLYIKESGNSFTGAFEYDAALFDASTIARMASDFSRLLESVARDADQRIGLEQLVLERFRNVLGNSSIDPDDSFLESGGDSLLALRLLAEMEKAAGVHLPLVTLFEHPTVGGFAAALREALERPAPRAKPGTAIVEIKSGFSQSPLFLIPGGSGGNAEMTLYAKMVSYLRKEQSVYGVRTTQHSTIEARASACIAEIRRVQPRGPYALVGECLGGVVAFEMAQQLAAAGEQVTPLVLFDAWLPTSKERVESRRLGRMGSLMESGKSVLRIGLTNVRRERESSRRLRKFVSAARNWTHIVRAIRRAASLLDAVMHYQPANYPGPVMLVVSEQHQGAGIPEQWQHIVGSNLMVHTLPGTHESYIRNSPEAAARVLEDCLK